MQVENSPLKPEAKRKKYFTKREIADKLKGNENDVKKVVDEMIEELCPFDVNDNDALIIEDRIERLEKVSRTLQLKVHKLKSKIKDRKFRHNPEILDENEVTSSQHSLFASQEDHEDNQEEDVSETDKDRPKTYTKKPLNQNLSKFARRRRVMIKRDTVKKWALEEGVTETELLGYLLHLENYRVKRDIAAFGWKLFIGEDIGEKPEISLEEAIWLREKSGMSEAVYQEVRLRFLNR